MITYTNSILYGVSEYQIGNLQRIMNASARFVYWAPDYCHITPLLRELVWSQLRLRIDLKILRNTFKILQSLAPGYFVGMTMVYCRLTRGSKRKRL